MPDNLPCNAVLAAQGVCQGSLRRVDCTGQWSPRDGPDKWCMYDTAAYCPADVYNCMTVCRPQDFRVGGVINVHGRDFLLYDCDAFTRQWYEVRGQGSWYGCAWTLLGKRVMLQLQGDEYSPHACARRALLVRSAAKRPVSSICCAV